MYLGLLSEQLNRRAWLRATIGFIVAMISSIVGLIVGGAVIAPALASRREHWVPAGRLPDLDLGVPVPITVRTIRVDGYEEVVDQQLMFLVRSPDGGIRALSSTCTHLGCRVAYDPIRKVIKCPCHGGTFAPDGRVISGPPPRGLGEIPARIDGARVFVKIAV